MVHWCPCPCHPSNKDIPNAECRPVFQKTKRKKRKKRQEANVNISAGHWIFETPDGATCQSKATAFCGQPGDCTRLCAGCVSKWERQTKLEEPHNFAFYLLHKPGIIISISRCNMVLLASSSASADFGGVYVSGPWFYNALIVSHIHRWSWMQGT